MAKTDWASLLRQYCQDYDKHKTSPQAWCEANGLNYASARRYIKVPTDEVIAQAKERNETHAARQSTKNRIAKEPKPKKTQRSVRGTRGTRHDPPTNALQKGHALSLKHGAYSKRMLLPDDIIEDAKHITLHDELHRLRANNLMAAEAVGRYRAAIEDADNAMAIASLEVAILNATFAMNKNTQRIESLVRTISVISAEHYLPIKMQADINYRIAATEKVKEEIEVIKAGDNGGKAPIVVHNMLPMLEQD